MNRTQKEAVVSQLGSGIEKAQVLALMSFNKLTVEQITSFRLSLSKQKVKVRVVKNTLAKRVFESTPFKDMTGQLKGPTLIAYSDGDPVTATKAIAEWLGKENFDLKIKSSAAMGQMMSQEQFKALSKLPGRSELLVGFLWALKSSPTKFLYALSDAPKKLGYALGALKAKKEKEAA